MRTRPEPLRAAPPGPRGCTAPDLPTATSSRARVQPSGHCPASRLHQPLEPGAHTSDRAALGPVSVRVGGGAGGWGGSAGTLQRSERQVLSRPSSALAHGGLPKPHFPSSQPGAMKLTHHVPSPRAVAGVPFRACTHPAPGAVPYVGVSRSLQGDGTGWGGATGRYRERVRASPGDRSGQECPPLKPAGWPGAPRPCVRPREPACFLVSCSPPSQPHKKDWPPRSLFAPEVELSTRTFPQGGHPAIRDNMEERGGGTVT